MDRPAPAQSGELTLGELDNAQGLAVIASVLAETTIDDESLRRGVWTYVRSERYLGTSPASIIVALTELVESSEQPPLVRQFITRQVILWCVDAYFGYLGGEVVGGADAPRKVPPAPPMIVSNR
ncbi:MAG TPA: hypothetical protein VJN70_17770 [Gemmatimonadaceae bacterium]|nr:hypothetical protein [Gemmatimonadaceae bacterium]